MLSKLKYVLPVLLLMVLAVSCSSGGGSAVSPSTDGDNLPGIRMTDFRPGHNVFGMATVYFDTMTQTFDVVYDRTGEIHLNLSAFLTHPDCPAGGCMRWQVTDFNGSTNEYKVDVRLYNPTIYEAHDMRLLFMGLPYNSDPEPDVDWQWEVVNPDSYCTFYDTDPLWSEDEQWLNPFLAFEKEDEERIFLPDPDNDGTTNGPETYMDNEELILYVPPDCNDGAITVILDASWPDHCKEPYEISRVRQTDDLPVGNSVSSVFVECIVADWQEDIVDVSLYIPDIMGDLNDGYVEMIEWPTSGPNAWPPDDGNPLNVSPEELEFLMEFWAYDADTLRRYYCNVTNEELVSAGDYEALIIAQSIDTDAGPGDYEYDRIYQKFDMVVDIGGSGGDPTAKLQIVYASYENEINSDIWTHFFLTGDDYRLTNANNDEVEEIDPCISSDGLILYFASNLNMDGFPPYIDDFELYEFAIPYSGGVPIDQGSDNTASWVQLTNNGYDDLMPDISPDGNQMVWVTDQNGQFEIYHYNFTTSSSNRVTSNYGSDEAPHYDRTNLLNDWIFFHSNRSGGNYEIWGIDPNDEESSTNLAYRYTFTPGADLWPATSPNLAMPLLSWHSERYGLAEILITDYVDTYRLTENEATDTMPSFSSDGSIIAFASDRKEGNMDVWRMTYQGENVTRITDDEMPEYHPSFGGG